MRLVLLFAVALTACVAPVAADYDGGTYTKDEALKNIKTATTKRGVWLGISALGFAGTVTGIVLMSSADWETQSTGTGAQATTDDPRAGVGLIMVLSGTPFAVGGTIGALVKTRKVHEMETWLRVYSVRAGAGIELICGL